jgi:hypothetical protein
MFISTQSGEWINLDHVSRITVKFYGDYSAWLVEAYIPGMMVDIGHYPTEDAARHAVMDILRDLTLARNRGEK